MQALGRMRFFLLLGAFLFVGIVHTTCAQSNVETGAPKTVSIPAESTGGGSHFIAHAKIGSLDVDFVVDTGASFSAISVQTAQALGLKEKEPARRIMAMTASGPVMSPVYILSEVWIGDIVFHEVSVAVLPAGVNLLGNAELLKLKRFEYRDGVLTLEQ